MRISRVFLTASAFISFASVGLAAKQKPVPEPEPVLEKMDTDILNYSCMWEGTSQNRVEIYQRTKKAQVLYHMNANKVLNISYVDSEKHDTTVRYTSREDATLHNLLEVVLSEAKGKRYFEGLLNIEGRAAPVKLNCLNHVDFPYQVTAFRHNFFYGSYTSLTPGFNNVKELEGVGNNSVSSFRVPQGVVVIACSEADGKGQCWAHTKDVAKLTKAENDKVTSLGVFRVQIED